jgi:hypothetical protein
MLAHFRVAPQRRLGLAKLDWISNQPEASAPTAVDFL